MEVKRSLLYRTNASNAKLHKRSCRLRVRASSQNGTALERTDLGAADEYHRQQDNGELAEAK